jgi:hypothetical protein
MRRLFPGQECNNVRSAPAFQTVVRLQSSPLVLGEFKSVIQEFLARVDCAKDFPQTSFEACILRAILTVHSCGTWQSGQVARTPERGWSSLPLGVPSPSRSIISRSSVRLLQQYCQLCLPLPNFESWPMAVGVFVGLNLIQFAIGSCLEPLLIGTSVSISPFAVIFTVFFWSFMWGVPGAFIGVPVLIAFIVYCAHNPSTRWIAILASGKSVVSSELI